MKHLTDGCRYLLVQLRKHWVALIGAAFVLLVLLWDVPAWAAPVVAPLNQTVPAPTPTSEFDEAAPAPAPPTATPRPTTPDDGSGGGSGGGGSGGGGSGGSGGSGGGSGDSAPVDPDAVPFVLPSAGDASAGDVGGLLLTAEVTVSTLNVRAGPGTSYAIIGTLSAGDTVTVTARNPENTWWFICCVAIVNREGWVSAPLLQPAFDRTASEQLIPVYGETQDTPSSPAVPEVTDVPAVTASLPISLTMQMNPPLVWQGQTFGLEFRVTNPNNQSLRNVELSNELPAGLLFVDAQGEGEPSITNETSTGGELVLFHWTSIPAGARVQAVISGTVGIDLANGTVVDNLAAVRAANGVHTTREVSLGLPPAIMPEFEIMR